MQSNQLVELVPVKSLEKIPVADTLLAEGGKVINISPEKFKQVFGCDYSESVWVDKKLFDALSLSKKKIIEAGKNSLPKDVKHRLNNPSDKLAICYTGPKSGYALVATADIPQGEILFVNAGQIARNDPSSHSRYVWKLSGNLQLSADNRGGLYRFAQHGPFSPSSEPPQDVKNILDDPDLAKFLSSDCIEQIKKEISELDELNVNEPSNHHLDDFELHPELNVKDIATVNTKNKSYNLGPYELDVIISKGIKKNQLVMTNYGRDFWKIEENEIPLLFFKTGKSIPLSMYKPKEALIFSRNSNGEEPTLTECILSKKQIIKAAKELCEKGLTLGSVGCGALENRQLTYYNIISQLIKTRYISPEILPIFPNKDTNEKFLQEQFEKKCGKGIEVASWCSKKTAEIKINRLVISTKTSAQFSKVVNFFKGVKVKGVIHEPTYTIVFPKTNAGQVRNLIVKSSS